METPFTFLDEYLIGTLGRQAVVDAYKHSQRNLVVIGICMCVPLIGFAVALRNPKLNDNQTLADGMRWTRGGCERFGEVELHLELGVVLVRGV